MIAVGLVTVVLFEMVPVLVLERYAQGEPPAPAARREVKKVVPRWRVVEELFSPIDTQHGIVLARWLAGERGLRLADLGDYPHLGDVELFGEACENSNVYYAAGDFDFDGVDDFAAVLVEAADYRPTSTAENRFTASLAVFNGPLSSSSRPAFFAERVATPAGAVLCLDSQGRLSVGALESHRRLLQPSGSGYRLK